MVAGLLGCRNYIGKILNEIDLEEGKLFSTLKKYVIEADTKVIYEVSGYEYSHAHKGMGIRLGNNYLTLGHIVNFSKGLPVRAPFGTIYYKTKSFETSINGTKLEKLIFDEENDVAIFKLPKKIILPEFPLKPRKEVYLGERIADIGNPQLLGFNCRIGKISDMDGIDLPEMNYKNSIGTDIEVIPGDSGTPVISMSDKKLLGLMGLRFWGVSYFQPIKNFLKCL
jgi:hypothetical protein